MRRGFTGAVFLLVAGLLGAEAFATERELASKDRLGTIEFEGKRWVTDRARTVTIEEYKGRTALHVRGEPYTYVYLPDAGFRDGTIEVDIAAPRRSPPGIGFRGQQNGERFDRLVFRPAIRPPLDEGQVVEQLLIARRNGTLFYLLLAFSRERPAGRNVEIDGWFHFKVVLHGQGLDVYLNDREDPIVAADRMLDRAGRGTIGVCGSDFLFANFRYTAVDRVAGETTPKPEEPVPVPLAETPVSRAR